MYTLLPDAISTVSPENPNGPRDPRYVGLDISLKYQAILVADLVYHRNFHDSNVWERCIGVYMSNWLGKDKASSFAETVRSHFRALDKVTFYLPSLCWHGSDIAQAKHKVDFGNANGEGELLCDTLFSLAYGALLLLSHTTLRLFRGRRYGILGSNGSGKSTLMRQLRDGKVENFPPPDQVKCVMVEHSLQGEDTSLSVIDFIAAGMSFLLVFPSPP